MSKRMRLSPGYAALPALYAILTVPGILLLFTAHTARGRLTGMLCLLLIALAIDLGEITHYPAAAMIAAPALLCLVVALWVHLSRSAERGQSVSGASVGSVFLGSVQYPRWFPSNFIPERDQVGLPVAMLTRLSPFMSRRQARDMRRTVRELYDAMDAQPDWRAIGSVLPLGLHALAFGPWSQEHYFYYAPPTAGERYDGAMIFLHGAGGNIKLAMWVLKEWADEHRMLLVFPSFGFGNWESRRAGPWVERVRKHVLQKWKAPETKVYLAGLSQGGAGVSRVARDHGQAYAGFVFISGVMERKIFADPQFAAQCHDRPILVMQGEKDVDVRPRSVIAAAKFLADRGLDVTCKIEPDADHFLLFGYRTQIKDWLNAWIKEQA